MSYQNALFGHFFIFFIIRGDPSNLRGGKILPAPEVEELALLLAGAVKQTAYEDIVTVGFNLGSLSTLCTLTATLDSHEEAAQSPIV